MATTRSSGHGLRIGRLAGVPIYLGRSWVLVAALIVVIFGPLLQDVLPDLGGSAYGVAALFVVLLLISVLVHEAAHSLVAQAGGYRVTRIVADFWGGHTAYEHGDSTPGRSALVAIAGPAANGALAGIGYLALQVTPSGVPFLLTYAFTVANAFVAVFNLLPGLPLDGGFLVDSLVWRITGSRATGMTVAGWCGRALVGVLAIVVVARPLIAGAAVSPFSLIWAAVIGAFLWAGAGNAIAVGRARAGWEKVRIAEVMRPAVPVSLEADLTQVRGLAPGSLPVAVDADGAAVGLLDPAALAEISTSGQLHTPVSSAVHAMPPGWVIQVSPERDLIPVVMALQQLRSPAVAITDPQGRMLGVVLAAEI